MRLALHRPGDLGRLRRPVAAERRALQRDQRDRCRAVLLAAGEQLAGDGVARRLGRSPRFADQWAGRYRRGGLDALVPRRPRGAAPKLSAEQQAKLKARLDAGPLPADGVCTLRGRDVVRILEAACGVRRAACGTRSAASTASCAASATRARRPGRATSVPAAPEPQLAVEQASKDHLSTIRAERDAKQVTPQH